MCLVICRCRCSLQRCRRLLSSSSCRRCLRIAVACRIRCYVAVFVARSSVDVVVARCRRPYVSVATLPSLVLLFATRRLVCRSLQRCCCNCCYFAVAPCLVRRSIVVVFVALSRLSSRCNIVIVFVAHPLLLYCSHC